MVDDFVKGFNLLKDLLLSRRGERKEETDKTRAAIISVEKAALATRGYLARMRNEPKLAAQAEESKLSDLWFAAHSHCLEAGQHALAQRCLIKAEGWVDENVWDDPRYAGVQISLESIIDSCRELTDTLPKRDA